MGNENVRNLHGIFELLDFVLELLHFIAYHEDPQNPKSLQEVLKLLNDARGQLRLQIEQIEEGK